MPNIDLSFLCDDPDLAEPFTVIRRAEAVGANGRNVLTSTTYQAFGSIQPKDSVIGGNVVERGEGGEYRAAALLVWTRFRLRSASVTTDGTNWQPDVCVFNGDQYLVTLTNDYTHYGNGFVQAELTSLPTQDAPPPGSPP